MTGWKQWLSGEVVEHTDLQTYIQDQVVQVYPGTAARSSALGDNLSAGMVTYLEDTQQLQYYNGTSFLTIDTGTDPAIFTAGVSGQLLQSLGTAGVGWLNQGSVVAGSASYAGLADYATAAGTAEYATLAGTADFATLSGTATFATTSGTASYATLAGTADFAAQAGTATFASQSGTAVTISGSIANTQVTGTAVTRGDTATVTNAMLAGSIENNKLVNSGITLNGTAVPLGGSATIEGGGSGFTNPMTSVGDLIVGTTAGAAARLGIGAAGRYLFSNGTTSSWNTLGTATTISGNIAPTQVTAGTFTAGAFAFGTAVTTGNTLTTGNAMRNITMSTATPTGGADGDVWLQYTP